MKNKNAFVNFNMIIGVILLGMQLIIYGAISGGSYNYGYNDCGDEDSEYCEGEDYSYSERANDTQREADLSRIMSASVDYQSNNSGNTPWSRAGTNDTSNFLLRYVDVSPPDGWAYSMADYRVYNCSEDFMDPNGDCYGMKYVGRVGDGGISGGDDSEAVTNRFNSIIYVYSNALCSDVEGEIKEGSGDRSTAMFMKLPSGAIICYDNH